MGDRRVESYSLIKIILAYFPKIYYIFTIADLLKDLSRHLKYWHGILDIRAFLINCMEKEKMIIKEKILKLVQKDNNDLPTLPVVINKIISVASDKRSTIDELGEVISYDQAITSKLLKLSNSIYYAQKTKVETIKRAITVIGFDEIVGIALGMELLSSFKGASGMNLNMRALWMHSVGVATSSKEIANRSNPGIATKIFLPALLHDIGKIIFSVFFKDEYKSVLKFAEERKKTVHYAENAIFKLDHTILSALLMKRWNFPNSIVLPCRFHHNPDSAPIEFKHHSYIIALADYITQKANIGLRGNLTPTIPNNSLAVLGLNQAKIELIVDQIRRKKDEIQAFFEITMEA